MTSRDKVMVIDDSRVTLEFVKNALIPDGYEVSTFTSAVQAIKQLELDTSYKAIVVDWMMPVMDGIEFLKKIKSDEKLKKIPVIMQTARTDKESILAGINAGAYYYLTKPFNEKLLCAILRAAVNDYKVYLKIAKSGFDPNRDITDYITEGRFLFKTIPEGNDIANWLGSFAINENVGAGLEELFINAVEHGNLGITYSEKSILLEEERLKDEIEKRYNDPKYSEKKVEVNFKKIQGLMKVSIKDEGNGFDYSKYLDFDPERAFDLHGRGIAMANKEIFEKLQYIGKGNEVIVFYSIRS